MIRVQENCFDRFAKCRIVLLGEASHGTCEFYRARAAKTRRLIEQHGFSIVAAEADWPDAAAVDRYVRHRPARMNAEPTFQRFPTWMWRNTEVDAFIVWMRSHNENIGSEGGPVFLWPRYLQYEGLHRRRSRISR
jgi:erythromycin esterase-like protein